MDIKFVKKFFGLANLEGIPVKVDTDLGPSESKLKGQLLFEGTRRGEGINMRILALSATIAAAKCKAGPSGTISLGFIKKSDKLSLDKDGALNGTLKMNLHYPLLDRLHGYRKTREKERDDFIPFIAPVKGTFKGKFERAIESILREYRSIDTPPTAGLAFTAILVADDYYIKKIEFTLQAKMLFPLYLMKTLTIQPVFVRSDPIDPSPTGWSFNTLMENARVMWRKCCINLETLPPVFIDNAAFKSITSEQDATNLRAQVTDNPDAIEIFVAGSLGTLEGSWGGGACFSSGTAAAQIVTCDRQLEVYEGTTSRGAINYNHYAHELGHVLSLSHPGIATWPPMVAATAGTVMEPSGFYADNPHQQSHFNCDNADNPILRWTIVRWSRRCRHNPEV